jgi:hypothetical protein
VLVVAWTGPAESGLAAPGWRCHVVFADSAFERSGPKPPRTGTPTAPHQAQGLGEAAERASGRNTNVPEHPRTTGGRPEQQATSKFQMIELNLIFGQSPHAHLRYTTRIELKRTPALRANVRVK